MKILVYLTLLSGFFSACNRVPISQSDADPQWINDSIRYIPYEAYTNLDLEFKPITQTRFNKYVAGYLTTHAGNCSLDRLRLTEFSDCNEICETWVCAPEGRRFYWPGDYDAGIRGGAFSPDCKRYFVFATFDGPDFDSYYEHRAQLFIFNVKGRNGVNSLQPAYRYETDIWSIDDVTWINNSELGLKLYTGAYWTEGEELEYSFVTTTLPK
ncbi:MAG: hypothetical protein AAF598_07955 [Bacteroidota bacterium]